VSKLIVAFSILRTRVNVTESYNLLTTACNAYWLPFNALHHVSYIPLGTRKEKAPTAMLW